VGENRFLGLPIRPITARRLANFRANARGFWSLWIFLVLFIISLFAEFIANDKPILISYDGAIYFPVFKAYAETEFGGEFETEADYTDPVVQDLIKAKGWMVWPPIPYGFDTQVLGLPTPSPSPPSARNWLGTDDQARDVVARLIYGFRISVLFGLTLTLFSSIIGVLAGAVQGYFGGWLDLGFQRFIEMWDSIPLLYLLIILASIIEPNFWWLLGLLLLFSWMALGASDLTIMFRHVLPNAMVATLTFLPFILSGSVVTLSALDFLGFGLPLGSPSLGEMLKQGKANLHAPWLGFTAFFVLAVMLSLLIFIGEAVRDAFDPRKIITGGVPAEDTAGLDDTGAAAAKEPVR
jgi:microcin C transport system permease protein